MQLSQESENISEVGQAVEARRMNRASYAQKVKEASFDVKEQTKKMQEFYLTGKLM